MRVAPLIAALAAALAAAGPARAMTFGEAFTAAVQHDPQYRAAGFELESVRQSVPIARAQLLPSVVLGASGSDVTGSRSFPNALNQDVTTRVTYQNPAVNLGLRMPIYNPEGRSRLKQAEAQTESAESTFRLRGLDLVDRLGGSYLQVLLADEGKRLAQAQVRTLESQLQQTKGRLERGEGTRVDVAQTQAALDVARVRVIEADDQIDLAQRTLRRLTGIASPPLRRVPTDYMPQPMVADGLVEWLSLAIRQSPSLRAKEQALTAAKMNVERQFAGHLPRLDLVASLSRSQNESLSNLNQTATLRAIGVQLNVPIYSGGAVDASVKQALADQARAEEDIRAERENIEIEVQRQHQVVANGATKITANLQAVDSSAFALEGARRAFAAGVGTNNDVTDAQARLYSAQRDLAQARIEYLLARLRLMLQAGMSMEEAANDLDRALVAAPEQTASTN